MTLNILPSPNPPIRFFHLANRTKTLLIVVFYCFYKKYIYLCLIKPRAETCPQQRAEQLTDKN